MRCKRNLTPLMEALGYPFSDAGLLSLALTHPSASAGGEDNQRLEFLGDAVLQLTVSAALYARYPKGREGELTRLRASLVREETLAAAARRLSLGAFLSLDHGEEATGGRDKPSVLADAMEAVLAAVYLDGGLQEAARVCALALDDFAPPSAERNFKSLLQEREQAGGRPAPEYRVVCEEGPPHSRVFFVEVYLSGEKRGEGQGPSKKQAEQEAARGVLEGRGPGADKPRRAVSPGGKEEP